MKIAATKPGSPASLIRRYAAFNLLILLLPTALAFVYYDVSARAIIRATDALALGQLEAGRATLDRAFSDLRRSAARFASDYDVNLYLNNPGPLSGIEIYNLKRISDKVAPLVLGSDLVSDCLLYFARSDMVAYQSGFSAFDGFYGSLLTVEGMGPEGWRETMLSASEGEVVHSGLRLSFEGRSFSATAAVWPLGYGEYNRGAVVGIMDERNLVKPLERLAADYDGWVAVLDGSGSLISVSGDGDAPAGLFSPGAPFAPGGAGAEAAGAVRIGASKYRLYRSPSAVSGWSFAAALDEGAVLAQARATRDTALVLLGLTLVGGIAVSVAVASSQARPLRRLFGLLLGAEGRADYGADERPGSVYQRAEEAILALADSRDRLKAEASEAEEAAREYFLRRLLEGAYRERALFDAEADRFGIDLSGPARFVLLCRTAAPQDPLRLPAGTARKPGAGSGPLGLRPGEYGARLSLEETAYVLLAEGDRRSAVARAAEAARSSVPAELRAGLSVAAGLPAADPFLLQASCLQARAVLGRGAADASGVALYEDLPESPGGLRFAIDVEESIAKAVRSANVDLLASLVDSSLRANFEERTLPPAEAEDLAVGFRLAAVRLLPEFPAEAAALRDRLYSRPGPEGPRAAIEEAASALAEMAEAAGRRKRSRNRELARKARAFIEANYASRDLGLTMVAEAHGISENYLSNLYKEQEGECVSETIERVRIDAARRLLEAGGRSIDDIAGSCGYAGGVPFRRAFKRAVGISPSDYRATAADGRRGGRP